MNYAQIRNIDVANGPGIRVTLFVSGCQFHCKNCFNQEAQDYEYGKPYTRDTETHILELLSSSHVKGLSILGGDPLWQNVNDMMQLIHLCEHVHNLGKDIWLWTGFTIEEIYSDRHTDAITSTRKMLAASVDTIVDGPYVDELRDLNLKWRGSSNQRIISTDADMLITRYRKRGGMEDNV